jgi:hypothetical protein
MGLWLRFTRPHLPGAATGGIAVEPLASATTLTPSRPKDYPAVVSNNIFAQQRTPPGTRFVPPGQTRLARRVAPRLSGPMLYGITMGPRGAVALIHEDARSHSTQLYQVGDSVAGVPIVAISESTVTLARPSGHLVLRLPTQAATHQ